MFQKLLLLTFSLVTLAVSQGDVSAIKRDSLQPATSLSVNKDSTSLYPMPYFIPGDAIKISVYPDSALFLNGFYQIDYNGFVDLPIIGLVSVKNLTREQFIEALKNEYSDYLRYPNINVSTFVRISLTGGFFRPGLYWVEPRNSLWSAMQIAGGVNREDGLKLIRWERDGKIVSTNIISQFQSGTSLAQMGFKSGDQLCVTTKPKMVFWDVFKQDIMPVLSFSLSTAMTSMAAYQTYRLIRYER